MIDHLAQNKENPCKHPSHTKSHKGSLLLNVPLPFHGTAEMPSKIRPFETRVVHCSAVSKASYVIQTLFFVCRP